MLLTDQNGFSLTLIDDLEWIDEFSYSPVRQSKEVASNGTLVIEEALNLSGRPITLQGGDSVIQDHATVVALQDEIAVSAGKTYQLTLPDGRVKSVKFDHENGAIDGPVPQFFRKRVHDSETYHYLTIRFIEV